MIQFDICQKACSSSKQGALIAEEIKQQNWEPSFVRVCRCYATVPHSTEPPSNIVTLVIFMVELYEADATQCSAACLLLQLQLADTDSTVLVQLRTRTFMMQHVNLIFIKCHDTVFLSRSSKLIVITSPSRAIQNFRIVRNVVGQKQLFIARDVWPFRITYTYFPRLNPHPTPSASMHGLWTRSGLGSTTRSYGTVLPLELRPTRCLPRWCCRQRRVTRCLATVIGESGFEAQAGRIIVSGYSDVCFEIKFSSQHRGFDGVVFNL